jgi:DnaJ-class molecular chaperone
MKKYHPDRFQEASQKKNAEEKSSKINVAYDFFKRKFKNREN